VRDRCFDERRSKVRDFKPLIAVNEMIDATPSSVWDAATHKTGVMFMGADVKTDWHEGHAITFSGEWKGKPYQDKGEVQTFERDKKLAFTHFSQSSGKQDIPENYNLVSIELEPKGEQTSVRLTQSINDKAEKPDVATVAEFEKNWRMMLGNLKKAVEQA
jgi:uncharacterized protein YndB with AHSA1/START domain